MSAKRIFIVEDEAIIAMELSVRLEEAGFEVCGTASSGERALVAIAPSGAELVLMDIGLAGALDGVETAVRLRDAVDVPVVFLSAFSDSRTVADAMGVGPYGYLVKPFSAQELNATLRTAFEKHRQQQVLKADIRRLEGAVEARQAEFVTLNADLERRVEARAEAFRAIEARARRAQRMESIGTLVGGIAHDLNNTLAPVLMAVDFLRHGDADEREECVAVIEKCVRRATDMVQQLLTFARGVEGQWVFVPVRHPMTTVEAAVRASFGPSIQVGFRQEGELSVMGDAAQLHHALLRLCENARDAMPHGGSLTVSAELVTLDGEHKWLAPDDRVGPHVRLAVRDTGVGIAPEHIEQVFDPFFTTKGPDRGPGLGLSTVAGIVKGHGGFVRVESRPNQGSTFEMYLPSAVAPAPALVADPSVPLHGRGQRVLVIEESSEVRAVIRRVLTRLDFDPADVGSGEEALAYLAQHRSIVRVIIANIDSDRMDPLVLCRSLRRLEPHAVLIALTEIEEDGPTPAAHESGVTHVLHRPFSLGSLTMALRAAVDTRASLLPPTRRAT